jgi:hypothetical protein
MNMCTFGIQSMTVKIGWRDFYFYGCKKRCFLQHLISIKQQRKNIWAAVVKVREKIIKNAN